MAYATATRTAAPAQPQNVTIIRRAITPYRTVTVLDLASGEVYHRRIPA